MMHSEGKIWCSHCGVAENSNFVGCDAVSVGITLLITMGGGGWGSKFTMGTRNFNLQWSIVRIRWEIVSNQSLIYRHHFPPCLHQSWFASLQLICQKPNYSCVDKIVVGGGHLPLLPSPTKVTPVAISLGRISDVSKDHGSFYLPWKLECLGN
jgi:hypothetical protein